MTIHSIARLPGLFLALLLVLFAAGTLPAAAAEPVDRGYVLGPNDTIQIQVYGQPDAGITTRIKPDGTIVMPLIGVIQAAGQTTVALADTITKKFVAGAYFKNPVVNIEIGGYVSKTVNVAGKVTNPGVYPLDKNYRTLEMLLKAGWIKDAGASYVYLRRGSDYKEIQLDTEAHGPRFGRQGPAARARRHAVRARRRQLLYLRPGPRARCLSDPAWHDAAPGDRAVGRGHRLGLRPESCIAAARC